MEAGSHLSLALQILAGVGLAAAAGLRAFLPPLVAGLLVRLDVVAVRGDLEWLGSTPALIIFGTAVLAEILADKVPLLDHALDLAGLVVKPAAGALVMAAPLVDLGPLPTLVLALVIGGGVAAGVQVTKSGLRLASTGTTSGLGNPVLSAAEDGLSLTATLLALLKPLLLLVLLVICLLFLRRVVQWMQARARRRRGLHPRTPAGHDAPPFPAGGDTQG
jgi:hypothetical protein